MWLIDASQGFGFGLGFAPFLAAIWIALRLLDRTVFRDQSMASLSREKEAFERGYQEGLKSQWIERMTEHLDHSIAEKVSSLAVRGKPRPESPESVLGRNARPT